jgi:16S rRNA (guanine966-N2)-methyltransferase
MTRIVAGSGRGRRLVVPTGVDTRPTSDRAREALFSALESLRGPLVGARVLDLYAGSGALGLEACSRGAGHVLLVESDARAAEAVRANIATLGLPGPELRQDRVEHVLERTRAQTRAQPYDVVLLDPPYRLADDAVLAVLTALMDGWLAPGAVVSLERSNREPALTWPDGFEVVRERSYGEARIALALWYRRES